MFHLELKSVDSGSLRETYTSETARLSWKNFNLPQISDTLSDTVIHFRDVGASPKQRRLLFIGEGLGPLAISNPLDSLVQKWGLDGMSELLDVYRGLLLHSGLYLGFKSLKCTGTAFDVGSFHLPYKIQSSIEIVYSLGDYLLHLDLDQFISVLFDSLNN